MLLVSVVGGCSSGVDARSGVVSPAGSSMGCVVSGAEVVTSIGIVASEVVIASSGTAVVPKADMAVVLKDKREVRRGTK